MAVDAPITDALQTEADTAPFIESTSVTRGYNAPHFILPHDEFLYRTIDNIPAAQNQISRTAVAALEHAQAEPMLGHVQVDRDTVAALSYWENWLTSGTNDDLERVHPHRRAEYITTMAARDRYAQHSNELQMHLMMVEPGNHPDDMASAANELKARHQEFGFSSMSDLKAFATHMFRLRNDETYQSIIRPAAKHMILSSIDPELVVRHGIEIDDKEVDAAFFDFYYLNHLFPPYALTEDGDFAWDVATQRLGLPVPDSKQLTIEDNQYPDVDVVVSHFRGWNKTYVRTPEQEAKYMRRSVAA